MPVTLTYPGVYVEEISSGVRTITGVATSITAFIGRAPRGPANDGTLINSFADFERRFGGLQVAYPMSYGVRDFYLNGGTQAIIVRVFNDPATAAARAVADVADASTGAAAADVATAARGEANKYTQDPAKTAADKVAKAAEDAAAKANAKPDDVKAAALVASRAENGSTIATYTTGKLTLRAANPGAWGNKLAVRIDKDGITDEVAQRFGLKKEDLFNITVVEDPPDGSSERIRNVTLRNTGGARRIDRALKAESSKIRVNEADLPTANADMVPPADTATDADPTNRKADKIVFFSGGGPGSNLSPSDFIGSAAQKTGLNALDNVDLFNLLCIPPDARDDTTDPSVYQAAMQYCAEHRAFLIVDPPASWSVNKQDAVPTAFRGLTSLGLNGPFAANAAVFFPRLMESDPLRANQSDVFVPCGAVAGVMARTDATRGVWKAPAGIDAAINGIQGLDVTMNDLENGTLNPISINCLRTFAVIGTVVWGARTLRGADQLADEYKYIPVRRTALFIEESLYRGLKWVVFEPNDEPLWSQIRLNVGAFMHNLFRQGAFQGASPREAYFVKCDKETTTQNDINLGIVNIVVGFAPLKPAEFVVLKLQQIAGQVEA